MKFILPPILSSFLALSALSASAEESARQLLDHARDFAAAAPGLRRTDTTVQNTVVHVGTNQIPQPTQTNVVTIALDPTKRLARQSATIQGQEFVMIKQGDRAAMKLGSGKWEAPSGAYAAIARDMGNLFACEIETPETPALAPVWRVTNTENLRGCEALVIQTEGDSATPLAQERMSKGLVKNFFGTPEQHPTVKVLSYTSKHWIAKSDHRHLQAIQESKAQITMPLPNGQTALVEQSSQATSVYTYEKVSFEIPAEARAILNP